MAKVWHFKDENGLDVIKEWVKTSGVQKRELGKMQSQIDRLILYGSALEPLPLSESGTPHIKKLKIHGKVELRPLLCEIDADGNEEQYVLLAGAFEISWKFEPKDAPQVAAQRRLELTKDGTRKTPHVRLTKS